MQEDIAALKKGQTPAGFEVQKQSEKDIKPSVEAVSPRIIPPPRPNSQVELGRLERSKPLPGGAPGISLPQPAKPVATPPLGSLGGGIKIPSLGGGSFTSFLKPKNIGLIAAAVVVIGFLVWFFAIRMPSAPQETLSPTPTFTQTAKPLVKSPIERAFGIIYSVNMDLGGGPQLFSRLLDIVDKNVLSGGGPVLYKVSNSQTGQRYGFNDFMSSALVTIPPTIAALMNNADSYLSLLLKADGSYSYAFLVKLNNTTPGPTVNDIKSWESGLSNDLKNPFGLDLTRAASVGFLDNAYQGMAIRYRNFPDPYKTIDYVVITMASGDKYLVFANSREHLYTITDKLLSHLVPAQ